MIAGEKKSSYNKIGYQLTTLKQRSNQTVAQLIAYIESLEDQLCEPFQDSVRALFFLQALHDYIRKEIGRRDTDSSNRRAVEEAARQIEAIEAIKNISSARYKGFQGKESKDHHPKQDGKGTGQSTSA